MNNVFLVNYKVKGIKTLDQMVSLSFYKKTITLPLDTQNYNIKGIYGMNGSGKSGIVTSVDILKSLLTNENYLTNPVVQKKLDAIINKKTKELFIGVDYIVHMGDSAYYYQYEIVLKKGVTGKYYIDSEKLSSKRATSRKDEIDPQIEIKNGEIIKLRTEKNDVLKDLFIKKTTNLLTTATFSALFMEKIFASGEIEKKNMSFLFVSFLTLFIFGKNTYVYMEESDSHTEYFLNSLLRYTSESKNDDSYIDSVLRSVFEMEREQLNMLSVESNIIRKELYGEFKKTVGKLAEFIRIFKTDLKTIEIDKKENDDYYVCSLEMVYDKYSINAEFESTGIKKLIKLFAYLQEMVRGGIVFIDEFDSNLHDVYLCALLEYLMDYGEGQLCFTTHNVGPMDVLKRNSKSIDFLSTDHTIYQWTTNGHYSPSKLYRNGMIAGSPFNVDSIDFIGVFDTMDEE